jgi:hypothetical protein
MAQESSLGGRSCHQTHHLEERGKQPVDLPFGRRETQLEVEKSFGPTCRAHVRHHGGW